MDLRDPDFEIRKVAYTATFRSRNVSYTDTFSTPLNSDLRGQISKDEIEVYTTSIS